MNPANPKAAYYENGRPARPAGYFSPDAEPAALRAFWETHGYLVLENAFTPAAGEKIGMAKLD